MHVTWHWRVNSRDTSQCPRPNLHKQVVWRHSNEKLRLPHTYCSSPIFVDCLFLPMSLPTHHSNLNVGPTEAQVHARISPRGICGGQNGTGTRYSQSSSVFHYQYHSTITLHTHISGVWTVGLLVATVQRHCLTPSTWTWTNVGWLNHSC
jgi:hypothetical protein